MRCKPHSKSGVPWVVGVLLLGLATTEVAVAESFVNFETPQVHPLDLSPDGSLLAVANTADNRLELFEVSSGVPVAVGSISVGLDPVSVRFRSGQEVWVVNQISDSVSVVDVPTRRVRATLATLDEPADVVFAGTPVRAFVSCSQANSVLVFDPERLDKSPVVVPIEAEDPRALAVSPDGGTVYAAIFESGNSSTIVAGGFAAEVDAVVATVPDNAVSDPSGPYGGQNPPPNNGSAFEPAIAPDLPPPPRVSLIVKRDQQGHWLDDNGGDWSDFVSGSQAFKTRRPSGWDLLDRDVAVIDAEQLSVSYIERLMNLNMALAVNPATGQVAVVGTDGTNEVRFEPNLRGVFLRVQVALAEAGGDVIITDLNPHLSYGQPTLPQSQRNSSLGDPRAIVWNPAGTRAWVAGMGSNNLVVIDSRGNRSGEHETVEVGEGPTGLAFDEARGRLYVLNRFAGSLSVVDVGAAAEVARVDFFDPTPPLIRIGRRHLYDTHATSGLGHVACASCHVDGRMDRLAWDLGVPGGAMKSQAGQNTTLIADGRFEPWHPMKGPMTTQTLQDIIGKEPFHWRGDRDGIEEFNDAFIDLLGDDEVLSRQEMQEFEDFLATLHFPPNPFRNLDNSLPVDLPLPGHFRTGRFGDNRGQPLPAGNARRGLELFRSQARTLDTDAACVTCHSLPSGSGTPAARRGESFEAIPPGPNGEAHLALIGEDASDQLGFKVPQLRNQYDKVGFDTSQATSRAGFGFFHDGSVDSLASFVGSEVFEVRSDQEVADLVALVLSFSGSGFTPDPSEPPGSQSRDAHAAVGVQTTLADGGDQSDLVGALLELARTGAVELVAKRTEAGVERGWAYRSTGDGFAGDEAREALLPPEALLQRAAPGAELTLTVVPAGSGGRVGVDRDEDGLRNFDEVRDLDPMTPGIQNPFDPASADSSGDHGSDAPDGRPDGDNDYDGDGTSNRIELELGTNPLETDKACTPDATTLCLLEGRFRVQVTFRRDAQHMPEPARAIPFTDRSGLFWFFNQNNVEMLIKLLDACNLEGFHSYWVFFAATTDREFTVTVTDTRAGVSRLYTNDLGVAALPVTDTAAFDTCREV